MQTHTQQTTWWILTLSTPNFSAFVSGTPSCSILCASHMPLSWIMIHLIFEPGSLQQLVLPLNWVPFNSPVVMANGHGIAAQHANVFTQWSMTFGIIWPFEACLVRTTNHYYSIYWFAIFCSLQHAMAIHPWAVSVKPSALTAKFQVHPHTWLQRISPMHLRHMHIASISLLLADWWWVEMVWYSHWSLLTWNDLQKHYEPLGSIGIDWDYHLVMAPFGSSWVPATLNLSRSWIAWIAWIGEVITQLVALPDKDSCESFRQLTTVQHGATRWNCFKSNFGRFGVVWCPWCHLSCDSASERESSS